MADLLRPYREKRDFSQTPEPDGEESAAASGKKRGLSYLIQKHAASRLHYDFRLELEGVLKSWAVTKGPSLDPSDKRLAVRTEDHPLAYGDFEGVIPSGYGAGTVMLWDQGVWRPRGDPHKGLQEGVLKFDLEGHRLSGGWALILMKSKSRKGRENWLLVKERDKAADTKQDPRKTWTTSVISDRSFEEIEKGAERAQPKSTRPEPPEELLPEFTPPQLASLRDAPPAGEDWIHELKFDGYRIQALISGDQVRLMTRNGHDWTARYPTISRALRDIGSGSAALDGELVALDAHGHSRFGALQAATSGDQDAHLAYYAFDLLWLNGKDFRALPLEERKTHLRSFLPDNHDIIRYSDHVDGQGDDVISKACRMGLEGIVSKKRTSRYRSGRGKSWLKSKCVGRDEFVIAGYRTSRKRGRPFASLLLGEYVGERLVYRGRVGTGFTETSLKQLSESLSKRVRKTPPFVDVPAAVKRDAVWVSPELVCEIAYTDRTEDGLLRHPSFLGLREDKEAAEVKKPEPEHRPDVQRKEDLQIEGVRITHPDRIVFEQQGATKAEIAEYMSAIANRMLPFLKDHPVSLVRCPAGAGDACFFQKHHTGSLPDAIGKTRIRERDGEWAEYLILNSSAALVSAAQMGALELHVWGAKTDRLERPDRLVLDLDPDEAVEFNEVKTAAMEVRDVLASAGLTSFALLTGGKGIHVIAPLERRRDWPDVKAAAKGLAEHLARAAPDRYVSVASKAKRKGKIYIDWLRNERGATAICPYSLRARPGAPIATPIAWAELGRIERANQYTLSNILRRLGALKQDPWAAYSDLRQSLSARTLDVLSGA
ncbi:DNA ligase D [Hyphomonas sp.]|jgi:bifunctional non-homologous end joining protein LigD|uniref:DNA ligase D n=1 Tax=Hyphomonas sp. TaxID=87 RepID=UPI0030033BB6